MEAHEFTGWVDHIFPKGQYGQEIAVRDHEGEADKPKYPTTLRFNISTKCGTMADGLGEGDKIKVKFYLTGVSGIGKNGYYAINRLNVAKDGGIVILETAERVDEEPTDPADNEADSDLPF